MVSDMPHECKLACFSESDSAWDTRTSKSTTERVIAIVGPNTLLQIVALDVALCTEGLPMLTLWESLLQVVGQGPALSAAGGPMTSRSDAATTPTSTWSSSNAVLKVVPQVSPQRAGLREISDDLSASGDGETLSNTVVQ